MCSPFEGLAVGQYPRAMAPIVRRDTLLVVTDCDEVQGYAYYQSGTYLFTSRGGILSHNWVSLAVHSIPRNKRSSWARTYIV